MPSSNSSASASGSFAVHENRQLLVPWMWTFGYLSSYGISNWPFRFSLPHTSRRFQRHPLLTLLMPSYDGRFARLKSLCVLPIVVFFRLPPPLWPLSPHITWLFESVAGPGSGSPTGCLFYKKHSWWVWTVTTYSTDANQLTVRGYTPLNDWLIHFLKSSFRFWLRCPWIHSTAIIFKGTKNFFANFFALAIIAFFSKSFFIHSWGK